MSATRIFVGNLPFKIDEAGITAAFAEAGRVTSVKMITDKERNQFYGTAFVEFATAAGAYKAVHAPTPLELQGRAVRCEYTAPLPPRRNAAGRPERAPARAPSAKPEGCTTVFVGNLSYAIEEQHLIDFFAGVGEVKAVRWLTHQDSGEFKGIGFVEFWESASTDAAVALSGTPLLGRPARIDYQASGPR
jgi:nucleolin